MADQRDRLGSSGVFRVIVEGARKFKRALSEDGELATPVQEVGDQIGQAFVSGRFADIYAMTSFVLQQRKTRESFETSWRDAVTDRGPFTGFHVENAGMIDIGFIPGLEEVPQEYFVAFLRIAFSTPGVVLEDEKAFTIGAVLLDEGGTIRIGALHRS